MLIEAENIGKSLGGRTLFRDLNLTLLAGRPHRPGGIQRQRKNHAAENSGRRSSHRTKAPSGAPTLLKIVSFAQDRTERLDLEVSLRRTLCPEGDSVIYRERPIHVAGWAKRFLFRGRPTGDAGLQPLRR